MEETLQKTNVMDNMFDADAKLAVDPEAIVDGVVIARHRNALYINLDPFGTGIIYGREFINARDIIKNIHIGDTVSAKVVELENEEGYVELSLKEARQALTWSEADAAIKAKKTFDIIVKEANKGGLIMDWNGIEGFLPASQLSSEHYPRVEDGNKDDILKELRKLVGIPLTVSIISTIPKEGKLIFSEKGANREERQDLITKHSIGDELECEITGATDFGVFLKIEDGLEGLVHISELDWALVEDPRRLYKVGDKVKARIIEIKDSKISLSIKQLKPDPWANLEGKYSKDDTVSGVVLKFNKHGALIAVEAGVAGLVHISEFGDEKAMREKIEIGKSYSFKITLFDPKDRRMTLGFQG